MYREMALLDNHSKRGVSVLPSMVTSGKIKAVTCVRLYMSKLLIISHVLLVLSSPHINANFKQIILKAINKAGLLVIKQPVITP